MWKKTDVREFLSVQPFWDGEKLHQYILRDDWSGEPIAVCYDIRIHSRSDALDSVPGIGLIGINFSLDPDYQESFCCGTLTKSKPVPLGKTKRTLLCHFLPGEFTRIFGIPADELTDAEIPLESLIPGRLSTETIRRISNAIDFNHAVNIARRYICAVEEQTCFSQAGHMVRMITEESVMHHGNTSVHTMEENTGYSARYLQNIFRQYLGIAPKHALSNMKFQYALKTIQNNPELPISKVSHLCGYYDQAHFDKVFRTYVGKTPVDFQAYVKQQSPVSR